MATRRKCFITYHHADAQAVETFVKTFDHSGDVFIVRRLGEMADDIVNSTSTDYVMRCIRERYISDSTVTLVLAGRCTWARRYVDWEIQASLRRPAGGLPNGLLGIGLPGFTSWPERLLQNTKGIYGYASTMSYPATSQALQQAIEVAFARRTTHAGAIVNPIERFGYNRQCT